MLSWHILYGTELVYVYVNVHMHCTYMYNMCTYLASIHDTDIWLCNLVQFTVSWFSILANALGLAVLI